MNAKLSYIKLRAITLTAWLYALYTSGRNLFVLHRIAMSTGQTHFIKKKNTNNDNSVIVKVRTKTDIIVTVLSRHCGETTTDTCGALFSDGRTCVPRRLHEDINRIYI